MQYTLILEFFFDLCNNFVPQCDQQKEGIINSPAKMDEYCREKGFAGWFETSAKENINIEEAARSLVHKVSLCCELTRVDVKIFIRFVF